MLEYAYEAGLAVDRDAKLYRFRFPTISRHLRDLPFASLDESMQY
jgi:hypothetical protein